MNAHGSHIYQLARPCGFQHERPCANAGFGTQKAFVSVHRWHHPGVGRHGASYQWPDRSHSHSRSVAGKGGGLRCPRESEGELERLGSSRVSRKTDFRLADGLFRLQRKPCAEEERFGLHSQSGGTSSKGVIQGGIDFVSQKKRDRIRRTLHLRMNSIASELCSAAPPGLDWPRALSRGLRRGLPSDATPWLLKQKNDQLVKNDSD